MSFPLVPSLLLAILGGCSSGAVNAASPPPCRGLRSRPFLPAARDADLAPVPARPRRARPTPAASGALGRMLHAWEQWDAAHQAYDARGVLAPAGFDWHYLDAVVLQRLARHDAAAGALRRALAAAAGLSAGELRLAEALLDAGDLARAEQLFVPLAATRDRAGGGSRAGPHQRGARAGTTEAIATSSGRSRSFQSSAPRTTRWRVSYRAAGRTADAERAARGSTPASARAGLRLDDPVLATVTSLRDDARATLAARRQAGRQRRRPGRHRRARGGAGARSLAGAGARQSGRSCTAAARLGQGRGALPRRGRPGLGRRGAALRLRRRARAAGEVGGRRRRVPAGAERRTRCTRRRSNNLGQILERRREFDGAADEYRQAVEASRRSAWRGSTSDACCSCSGDTDQAIVELEKLQQPLDAETPRYLFALSTAHVRAGRRPTALRIGGRGAAPRHGVRPDRAGAGHRTWSWRS